MKGNYQKRKKQKKNVGRYSKRKGQLNIFKKKYFKIKNRQCGRMKEETKKIKK